MRRTASAGRPRGRPMSEELSEALSETALDVLADEGFKALNADTLARRASAGKAGIYRRWRTMAALAAHAIAQTRLVTLPEDQGSLRADLLTLTDHWCRPLDRAECAAASLLGATKQHAELHEALDTALFIPLRTAVATIGDRSGARGAPISEAQVELLADVLEAVSLQRLAGDGLGIPGERLTDLVDEVLLPLATAGRARSEMAALSQSSMTAG